MKTFEEKIREEIPSLVVFEHAAHHDSVDVRNLVRELNDKYGDRANIIRVNASYNEPMRWRYKLQHYPTWILFKQSEELMRESGEKTITELEEMLSRAL